MLLILSVKSSTPSLIIENTVQFYTVFLTHNIDREIDLLISASTTRINSCRLHTKSNSTSILKQWWEPTVGKYFVFLHFTNSYNVQLQLLFLLRWNWKKNNWCITLGPRQKIAITKFFTRYNCFLWSREKREICQSNFKNDRFLYSTKKRIKIF